MLTCLLVMCKPYTLFRDITCYDILDLLIVLNFEVVGL